MHVCENLLYGYDVHELSPLNYETHGLWVRGSGPMAGPISLYSKIILNLKQS